jgi:hypothetical protein
MTPAKNKQILISLIKFAIQNNYDPYKYLEGFSFIHKEDYNKIQYTTEDIEKILLLL